MINLGEREGTVFCEKPFSPLPPVEAVQWPIHYIYIYIYIYVRQIHLKILQLSCNKYSSALGVIGLAAQTLAPPSVRGDVPRPPCQRRSKEGAGRTGQHLIGAANGQKLFLKIYMKIQIVISSLFACNKNKALQLQRVPILNILGYNTGSLASILGSS